MAHQGQDFISKLEENTGLNLGLQETARNIFSPSNFEYVGKFAIESIKSAGLIFVKFFLGLLFSYIFIIERKKIAIFLKKMRDGNFAFFYDDSAILAGKIGTGFGLIFRAQSIIAFINALMTTF